jgi:hypothetical protein
MRRDAEKAAFKVPVRGTGVEDPQSKDLYFFIWSKSSSVPPLEVCNFDNKNNFWDL